MSNFNKTIVKVYRGSILYILFILQDFLTPYMKDYGISIIASGDELNSIRIGVADLAVKDDVLRLLREKFEDFEDDAVRFELTGNISEVCF